MSWGIYKETASFCFLFPTSSAGQTARYSSIFSFHSSSFAFFFGTTMFNCALFFSALLAVSRAQQAGTQKEENHPSLSWQKCTSDGCTKQQGSVVIDANWRWVHSTEDTTNCYTGNSVSLCLFHTTELGTMTDRRSTVG